MRAYVIRRILLMIPTIVLATLIIFFIIRLIPGNVIDIMVAEAGGGTTDPAIVRAVLEERLGLDKPIFVQYGSWIWGIITRGDIGSSLREGTPVVREIAERWPITFELGLLALLVAQLIALPIGIYSALRQDSFSDYLARSFAILCISVPGFWLGTMVVVFPSIWWGYSSSLSLIPFLEDPLSNLEQFIIPAVVLGMALSGVTMRMTRTMMLEVMRQDYIRTAWSKGLRERVVVLRHALKNALIPVVTIVGLQLSVLIGGTVIIETIFGLPGMGLLIVNATIMRDYTLVTGAMLFFGLVMITVNLLIDLTYGLLDPRVKYE